MKKKRSVKKSFKDECEIIDFLNGEMNKTTSFVTHFDTKTSILAGISLAVIAISISNLREGGHQLVFVTLIIFSIISAILALYAVLPPRPMRKKGQRESIFYNKRILDYKSSEAYTKDIFKILKDRDAVIREYSTEIFNLYKYYYRPKRTLFKIARDLLIVGILLSATLFLVY